MGKANNKTKPTAISPTVFLKTIEPERRRKDGQVLLKFFNRVTGLKPKMWGPSIIGYGRYAYKYDSGREGEHLITGFSPRKTALTIYIMPGFSQLTSQLEKLGKHKTSKSCLYINKLTDIDMDVLETIVMHGVGYMRDNYQTWDK